MTCRTQARKKGATRGSTKVPRFAHHSVLIAAKYIDSGKIVLHMQVRIYMELKFEKMVAFES